MSETTVDSAVADIVFVTGVSDTTPNAFPFSPQTGVATNTVITFGPVTISGINAAALITVTGGSYSINGGSFTSANGSIVNGDQVRARHTSSGSTGTNTNTNVTIGGVLSVATSTTAGAASSILASLAAAMTPGTWAELDGGVHFGVTCTVPINFASVVSGAGGGSGGSRTEFCNGSMAYNPFTSSIELFGQAHGSTFPYLAFMRYRLQQNDFAFLSGTVSPSPPGPAGTDAGAGAGHGYDGTAIDPTTGDIYHRHHGDGVQLRVGKGAAGASVLTPITPPVAFYPASLTGTACWWAAPFTGYGLNVGSRGLYMMFGGRCESSNKALDGELEWYDPAANTWGFTQGVTPNFSSGNPTEGNNYSSVMEYSAVKNCVVMGGGYAAPSRLWRLNSTGGVATRLQDTPTPVGIQALNLCCDPVSGNFILMRRGALHELDPGTGAGTGTYTTYTTGSRVPPSGFGLDISDVANTDGLVSCQIPALGLIAYIYATATQNPRMAVYKHA